MPDINGAIQNATIDTAMGAAVGESAGDIATDIVLDELIDALVEEYAKASIEMQGKCDNYLSKYAKEDAEKRSLLDAKKISKEDYQAWQKSKILGGKQWTDMRDTLAQDLTHCNEIAADIINDRKCDVYALNHNYGTYEIEQGVGACTSYTLYDHDTVERLISQNPELLPKTKIDIPKDLQWNKQQLTSAVTQGILQGESIPSIAKRMAAVTDMDKNSAIRNARTATTGAENAGRVESYKRAEKMGIKVTQIWISTLDGRTRISHRHMMGEKRALGKVFSNKCRFPGDPQGPGWEVYNCRCTLIAEPDGSGYDLEKTIDKNLSKKGMTFDEWVNQQPLPRHYGESKQHYLERYAKHKKQLSFGEWLGEQAAPDSAIQSVWGDKKMSQMYNEIKAQSVTDANKFYKELGKLGKPSEVWEKYLTGQLDAEDMKNFEDILKKYLPAPTTNATAPIFTAKYEGKISKEAQDSLDKLKFKAGNPMDKDAADSYKVNPLYDKADKATTKNCQTSAFAYECRRQGYDVVALPKYGLNFDDPELIEILQFQNALGKDARVGWINKETGAPATLVIEHSNPMLVMSNSEMIDELENAIGKSGERYIMGVRWKGTTSCHAINIDRTPDGKLRIIDNQRGPLEKIHG
jgi:phage putative head morphogenesis protein, SPP1 gp7 family